MAKTFVEAAPSLGKAVVVILPVPYDKTTCYVSGTCSGPGKIIGDSDQIEYYEPHPDFKADIAEAVPIHTSDPLNPVDDSLTMSNIVAEAVEEILAAGKFPLVIGGDHSITYGSVRGLLSFFGPDFLQRFSVLHLDAHSDLRDSWRGNRHSHASVIRRLADLGVHVVSVGIRSSPKECEELMARKNIPVFYGFEFWNRSDIYASCLAISQSLRDYVYLTFDFDVLDPSIMTVGTPEPGGLTYQQALQIFKEVAGGKSFVGADFVEFLPVAGRHDAVITAVKLIYLFIGYAFKVGAWAGGA